MKTTIVPAQITTVEDKIAGNLNFTQILLLLAALFTATFIYAVLPSRLHFTPYKFPLIIVTVGISLTLAIRIKGKIIIQWFKIISTYALRPGFYVFNKNDTITRDIYIPEKAQKAKAHSSRKEKIKEESNVSISDTLTIEQVLLNPNKNVRFAFNKKGGIYVSVSEGK